MARPLYQNRAAAHSTDFPTVTHSECWTNPSLSTRWFLCSITGRHTANDSHQRTLCSLQYLQLKQLNRFWIWLRLSWLTFCFGGITRIDVVILSPSIRPLSLPLILRGSQGKLGSNRSRLGERWGSPWRDRQSTTELNYTGERNNHPPSHSHLRAI